MLYMQRFFISFTEMKTNLNAQLERNADLDYIILLEYYSEYSDLILKIMEQDDSGYKM